MKVIAQTAALQEALGLAGSIVASRTPKPVLQCVKLIASKEGGTSTLTLLATDLEAGFRYQITAVDVEQEGEALVPAEKLSAIVRESVEASLTIEVEKDICHIRGASSRFKIFGYDPGEYPEVGDFEGEGDFEVPAEILREMREVIEAQTLAKIDYIAIVDADTLDDIDIVRGKTLIALAVFIGKTRLIDNMLLDV